MKPMEYATMKDCLDQVEDNTDRLNQSFREIEKLGLAQDEVHKSCGDLDPPGPKWGGFPDRALVGKINDSVQAQTTTKVVNTLGLLHQFGPLNWVGFVLLCAWTS